MDWGAGADYGLGTVGKCLGPPLAGRPPFDQKRKKIPITTGGGEGKRK